MPLSAAAMAILGARAALRTEAALAHKTGNAVELSYRRGDFFEKRRALIVDGAGYREGKAGASAANVHQLFEGDDVDQPARSASA